MAEEGDSGEKTEQPTPRRKSKAREEGQVGLSREFTQLMSITAAFMALQKMGPYLWRDLAELFRVSFSASVPTQPYSLVGLRSGFAELIMRMAPSLMGITIAAAIVGGLTGAIQTKFLWTWKPLRPKLSHLHPIKGLKKPFTAPGLMNILKSIVKLAIICPIAYSAFFALFPQLRNLMHVSLDQLLPFTAYAANYVFWKIFPLILILAIADLIWQRWHTHKKLKMSKQEIKDERKAVEGDEATRRRIIAQGLNRVRQRILQSVPQADVVVTNPTHYAVALAYSMEPGVAPKVIAKGRGFMAQKIREIARANLVPVVERKPLARALFKSVEVGQEIPYELYQAVAELLAYVYRLKGRNPFQSRNAAE